MTRKVSKSVILNLLFWKKKNIPWLNFHWLQQTSTIFPNLLPNSLTFPWPWQVVKIKLTSIVKCYQPTQVTSNEILSCRPARFDCSPVLADSMLNSRVTINTWNYRQKGPIKKNVWSKQDFFDFFPWYWHLTMKADGEYVQRNMLVIFLY